MKKAFDFNCEYCGDGFNRNSHENKNSKRRFCSHRCYSKWLIEKCFRKSYVYIKRCPNCKNNYYTNVKKAKFCSRKCYDKHQWYQTKRSCKYCGIKFWVSRANRKRGNGKFCSLKCRYKYNIGENHPMWKGSSPTTHLIRHSSKYKQWRQSVFLRDDFTCQKCDERGVYLEAHHKKLFVKLFNDAKKYLPLFDNYSACILYAPLWDINNGITLCKKCHGKTKMGRIK